MKLPLHKFSFVKATAPFVNFCQRFLYKKGFQSGILFWKYKVDMINPEIKHFVFKLQIKPRKLPQAAFLRCRQKKHCIIALSML